MKVDAGLFGPGLEGIPTRAAQVEADGYDGALSAEVYEDPFLPLAIAAEHTRRVDLVTSIVVAFARNPMSMAGVAHDLNAYSKGRLVLGMGSQVEAHITRRFSMPWSRPAARMREYILAMRAIWDCWYNGTKLDFRGEFYQHTLMTPMFTPPDTSQGPPRVCLAAVGPLMTEVAGEVADGLILHLFTTERYFNEVTLPALERGLAKSGRRREDFEIMGPVFARLTDDEQAFAEQTKTTRQQIAFYASTPAYRGVLAQHGWEDLQGELRTMSKRGQWEEMGDRISDEMLDAFSLVTPAEQLAEAVGARYGGILDRLMDRFEIDDRDLHREQVARLRAL